MRKFIFILALVAFLGAAPKVMWGADMTSQAIERAWKEQVAQQKQQEAKWKALEAEAARLFEQGDKSAGASKKKSQ